MFVVYDVVGDSSFERVDGLIGMIEFEEFGDARVHVQDGVAVAGGVVADPGPVLILGEVPAV